MSWDLIATAPDTAKDGHDLLGAFMPGGRQLVVHWSLSAGGGLGAWVADDPLRPLYPTHYQELPELPADAGAPIVTELVPAAAVLGDPNFTLSVRGSGFGPDAQIMWNGAPEPTTVVSPTEVTTLVNMGTATVPASIPVFVQNGAVGAPSNTVAFALTEAAAPELDASAPTARRNHGAHRDPHRRDA